MAADIQREMRDLLGPPADVQHFSGRNSHNGFANRICHRLKILELRAARRKHDYTKAPAGKTLLVLHLPIGGHEDVHLRGFDPAEQLSVQNTCPTFLCYRRNMVARQFARE